MSLVAILTSHLTPGDAVSNDVVGMAAAFESRGFETRIYAGSADFDEPKVYPVSEIGSFLTGPDDLLLYHYSIGWDIGLDLLRSLNCKKTIKYHNVTPPEFFAGVSPWHQEKCREGREQLRAIVAEDCDLYLADSEYNRQELLMEGLNGKPSFVVPPFNHIERLHSIEADLRVLDEYRDGVTNILMVGRIAPQKGHPALIAAFANYYHEHNRNSRLLIVGKEERAFAKYSNGLRSRAQESLAEEAVHFIGEVTAQELKAFYLLSTVFAIASEHEGFCVPVVEAMSMKIPVVAYASSAITGTVGDSGIVLKERQPSLMAEAIHRLVDSEELNLAVGTMGWRRYEQCFSNGRIEIDLFNAVNSLS